MDFEKIKEIINNFLKKKNVNILIAIIIIMLFLLLALNVLGPSKDKDNKKEVQTSSSLEENIQNEAKVKDEYEREQKEQLTTILKKIEGVGNVDVMISFESGEIKVPAYDEDTHTSVTEETDSEGGKRINKQKNDGSKIVMKTKDEGNEPFILQTYKPKAIGVVVTAEGAQNSKTKYEIQKAVSNLYNLSVDKVNVYPMNS